MDISNWPMSKILQLPEDAFGTRFKIYAEKLVNAPGFFYVKSALALPEQFIIWELSLFLVATAIGSVSVRMAMGDRLPANPDEMTALQPLIPGFGEHGTFPGKVVVGSTGRYDFKRLKMPVVAVGRRLVIEVINATPTWGRAVVDLTISSIPKEIPDFYAGFPEDKFDEMIRLLRIGVKIR